MRRPHAVSARPRPPRALEAVPAAEGEDAGLHRPRGRPLPHADDPHARDDRDLARRRAGAAAQRGPRRGDRPRARHRPHAVRARGRAGARRCAQRRVRAPLPPQRAVVAHRPAAQPHPRGVRRDPHAHRCAGAGDARGEDRAPRRPRRLHQPRHRRRDPLRDPARDADLPARRDRAARRHRLRADRPLVHDLVETSRAGGRHPPERRDRRGDAVAARVHVRPRLPRPAGRARAPAGARGRARRSSHARRTSRRCCPTGRASSPTGSPTTSRA